MRIDRNAVRGEADGATSQALSKVPELAVAFWIAKVLATTLGETGGDALSMTLHLGYGVSTLIFLGFFVVTLAVQLRTSHYHPAAYWAVVVATTTVGTTTSDYMDRTLGLGYMKSSAALLALVLVILAVWHRVTGRVAVDQVTNRVDETFYWVTILVSNTLGTALGDYTADNLGLGFQRGALVFAALLAVVAVLYYGRRIPESVAFWAAYVLTRPLGATVGDTLTKAPADGGLGLGRVWSSLTLLAAMIAIVAAARSLRARPTRNGGESASWRDTADAPS